MYLKVQSKLHIGRIAIKEESFVVLRSLVFNGEPKKKIIKLMEIQTGFKVSSLVAFVESSTFFGNFEMWKSNVVI